MRPNCLRNPWFLITFFQGQPLIRIHSRFYLSETWTAADMSCWDSACTNSLATNSITCSVWNMKSPFWWFLSCLSWKEHKIEIKTMSWKKINAWPTWRPSFIALQDARSSAGRFETNREELGRGSGTTNYHPLAGVAQSLLLSRGQRNASAETLLIMRA